MDAPPRPGTEGDLDALWELFRIAFGAADGRRAELMAGVDPTRARVVDGPRGEVAAAAHVRAFRQWFGGRPVPLGGFSPVAVLPEHRGRGLGRLVSAAQLPDLRDRGEVVAGLYPAALSLYRAIGFEVAGSYVHRRFPAADLWRIRPAAEVAVRRGTVADVAAVRRLHRALAPGRDGTLERDEQLWAGLLPAELAGAYLYVVDDAAHPGEVVGYAVLRHGPGRPPYDYAVVVGEVLADDPAVLRALWRVAASSGAQAPDVHVIGPAEDDLFLLAPHAAPDVVRSEIRWMLRIVDLPGAVAARGWPGGGAGAVELEVLDEHAPWNAGRWVLEVDGGEATVRRGGAGRVLASVGGLSSWWAGYATASRLGRTGHLRGDAADLRALDGLLPAVPPVLPDFY